MSESETTPVDQSDVSAQPSTINSVETKQESTSDFAALAKTIRSRTTDLIAVAIVIVGGVAVGSQCVRWWSTTEPELVSTTAAPTNVSWGDDDTPVTLEFGDQPFQWERQTLSGNRETVFQRLVEKCVTAAKESRAVVTEIQPDEEKLLALLQRQQPVQEKRGEWRVYQIERPMSLVIATRQIVPKTNSQPHQPSRRVVCWGMAQPSRKGEWVLLTMRPHGDTASHSHAATPVELPAGARRIMSLSNAANGSLVAFAGKGTAGDWQQWFNDWFARQRWQPGQVWSESEGGWSASFVPEEESQLGRIDVSFSPAGEERLSGIVSVTRPARSTEEGNH